MGQLFCDERPKDSEHVSFFLQKRPPSQLKNAETTYLLRHDAIPIPPPQPRGRRLLSKYSSKNHTHTHSLSLSLSSSATHVLALEEISP
jgi:hypothetical protein